jgi:predicted CXXCH cytochrome family protein
MINRQFAALAAGLMILLPWAGSPTRAESIVSGKHNLSSTGPGTIKSSNETEICVFCHVPHNAKAAGPLWNRDQPASPYIPYTSTTRKITAPGAPTGASLLCLSCHDGTIALGKISSRTIAFGKTNFVAGDQSYIGTDLSDDHPISFLYSSVLANTELRVPSGAVKLDASGQLQCTACHSPHDNANGKFLVVNNIQSALCRNCHNKPYWAPSAHATSTNTWNGAGTNPWPHTNYIPQNVANNACENCHRPHTAPGKKQLLNSATEETNCLVCHSGTVATSAKNIQTELNKVSHHGVGSYLNVHDAAEAKLMGTLHVECQDCHNPHSANTTAGTAPGTTPITLPGSLSNVRGISIGSTDVYPVTAEYQICIRCHGDSTSKTPAARTARVIVQTNTRLEFDTANPSYHPIAGAGKATGVAGKTVPSLILPWTTSSIMKCTDCHNNNAGPYSSGTPSAPTGTGPNGPHGSANPLLLERQYSVSDPSTESAAAYALCYKCHSQTSILSDATGSFRFHSKHIQSVNTSCNVCHDPHGISSTQGSVLSNSRLINFQTGVVTQSGTQAIRWERVGTTGGRCYLTCHGKNHGPLVY